MHTAKVSLEIRNSNEIIKMNNDITNNKVQNG